MSTDIVIYHNPDCGTSRNVLAMIRNAGIEAMMAHPIRINRPLVVSPLGVKLCRPSEAVLDLIPAAQQALLAKEDGELMVDAAGNGAAT